MTRKKESYEEFKARLEKRGEYTSSLETPEKQREIEMILEDFDTHNIPLSFLRSIANEDTYSDSVIQVERILYWWERVKTIGAKRALTALLYENSHKGEFADKILPLAIHDYRHAPRPEHVLRNSTANLICALADETYLDEVISLAKNTTHQDLEEDIPWGMKERPHFVKFLGRFKKRQEVYQILLELIDDETVGYAAIEGLGIYGNPDALPVLEKYTTHPKATIRKVAKAASKKLEKKRIS